MMGPSMGVRIDLSNGEHVFSPSASLAELAGRLREALKDGDLIRVDDPAAGYPRVLNPSHIVGLMDYPIGG
jgi:hypothetical protein